MSAKLQEGQDFFLAAGSEVAQAKELRRDISGTRLSSGARYRLERGDVLSSRLDTLINFGLDGPKLSKEVIVIQEEMATLASLLSRQNFLELEPAELPGYRERIARLRFRMEALQLIWKELRPTYPLLEGQGLAYGAAIERGLTIGILVAEASGQLLDGLESLLSATDEGLFTEEFGMVLEEVLREWQGQSRSILDALEELRRTQEEGTYA